MVNPPSKVDLSFGARLGGSLNWPGTEQWNPSQPAFWMLVLFAVLVAVLVLVARSLI